MAGRTRNRKRRLRPAFRNDVLLMIALAVFPGSARLPVVHPSGRNPEPGKYYELQQKPDNEKYDNEKPITHLSAPRSF